MLFKIVPIYGDVFRPPSIIIRHFYVSPKFMSKEGDRHAITRNAGLIGIDEDNLRTRLDSTNEKIFEFFEELVEKKAIDPSVKENVHLIYAECEDEILDADENFNRTMADPSTSNIHAEKALHDRESAANVALSKANSLVLAELNEVKRTLSVDDTLKCTAIVVEQLQAADHMAGHNTSKAQNFMAKVEFLEKYGEDWNHQDYEDSEGSLVDDYADPNQEQPSHMDPDD